MDKRSLKAWRTEAASVSSCLLAKDGLLSDMKASGAVLDEELIRNILVKGVEISENEYSNRDLINWRRVRSIIEHENHLINHRITWLLLSQAGLLAAFSTIYAKWWDVINKVDSAGVSMTSASYMVIPLFII